MDKLKLTGQNLGRVFHCRLGRTCIGHAIIHITKQPNLKLTTWPKQLLGSLSLVSFRTPHTDVSKYKPIRSFADSYLLGAMLIKLQFW
jgi:hypothetical protein